MRHLALVQRGRLREPGLDDRIVDAALAEHCTDITEARTKRGEEPGYRLYTARWAPAAPPPSRTPAAASGRDRKPAPDPAAPVLPIEPGEWDIPREPLRHNRAVLAARVLTARLHTARRTARPLYDATAHQPPPEQLLLFAQEQPAAAKAGPAVDLATLRTDLEALGLTAEQLDYVGRAGQRLAALRKDAKERADRVASRQCIECAGCSRCAPPGRAARAPSASARARPGPRCTALSASGAHRRCRALPRECTTSRGWLCSRERVLAHIPESEPEPNLVNRATG